MQITPRFIHKRHSSLPEMKNRKFGHDLRVILRALLLAKLICNYIPITQNSSLKLLCNELTAKKSEERHLSKIFCGLASFAVIRTNAIDFQWKCLKFIIEKRIEGRESRSRAPSRGEENLERT